MGRCAGPASRGPGAQCCAEVWPCRGQIPGGGPRPTWGIVCPSLLSPPRAEAAPGVGRCGLAPTPTCLLVPDTSRKKKGHGGGEGGLSPGGGRCSLWESTCMSVNCWASHLPSRVGTLAWAHMRLLGGLLLLLAWRTVQSSHPASVSGWPGQGDGRQGTSRPGLGVAPHHGRKQQTLYTKAKSTLGKPCSHFTGRETEATGALVP